MNSDYDWESLGKSAHIITKCFDNFLRDFPEGANKEENHNGSSRDKQTIELAQFTAILQESHISS